MENLTEVVVTSGWTMDSLWECKTSKDLVFFASVLFSGRSNFTDRCLSFWFEFGDEDFPVSKLGLKSEEFCELCDSLSAGKPFECKMLLEVVLEVTDLTGSSLFSLDLIEAKSA
jgi:hypothetical protein